MPDSPPFTTTILKLEKFYGRPKPPQITDALELILFENVAYLADDKKRAAAFAALKRKIGTRPEQILKASQKQLEEITRMAGIVPELRAQRLRQIAELVHYVFKNDLAAELKKPLSQAKKSLKRFPTIGDPGAEKILLFTGTYPVLALESNGLRVLVRLGFADEMKSYAATYRGIQQALASQVPVHLDATKKTYASQCGALIAAHQLLRQHGQELCKRTRPLCRAGCPLIAECCYFQDSACQEGPNGSNFTPLPPRT